MVYSKYTKKGILRKFQIVILFVFLNLKKKVCFCKNVCKTLKIGVFSHPNLYPLLCKIGVKIQENVLETTRNRGFFFT